MSGVSTEYRKIFKWNSEAYFMEIEELKTLEGTEPLKKEWDSLVELSGNNVFSVYDFFRSWEKAYGDLAQMKIQLLYEDRKLVGILPLASENGVLKFATGIDYKGVSDYNDFIVNPQFELGVFEHIKDFLSREKIVLREIPQHSKTLQHFHGDSRFSISDSSEVSSKIHLVGSLEEYLSTIRSSYRSLFRKQKSNPDFSFEVLRDKGQLETWFEEFVKLHQSSWNKRGLPGCFADDDKHKRFRNFHANLKDRLFQDNHLHFQRLRHKDEIIAIEYSFIDRDTIYFYLGAMNENYRNLSPGILIQLFSLRDSFNRGLQYYDFLRGDENYKRGLRAVKEQNKTISSV